jgi:hypothetical protein
MALVGNLPGSPTAVVQPFSVKLSNRQLPMWALKTFALSTMARPWLAWRRQSERIRHDRCIPGARFVSLESGGHLVLGQTKIVRDELTGFFTERRDRPVERVAS